MDTSKEYIEMCSKAEKIQKPKEYFINGDYFAFLMDHSIEIYHDEVYFGHGGSKRTKGIIWLPRQDQLQEMIPVYSDPFKGVLLSMFYRWYDKVKSGFDTFEKLWLAFVMKEKYQLYWNKKEKDWSKVPNLLFKTKHISRYETLDCTPQEEPA